MKTLKTLWIINIIFILFICFYLFIYSYINRKNIVIIPEIKSNNEEEIINEDETYTIERLNFILAIKIVLNNSLDLIGIIPRETF